MSELMKAVAGRDEKKVGEIISKKGFSKAHLDEPDSHGNTPLNYACAMGLSEDLILQMIALGASCKIANKNGAMPLNHAVYSKLSGKVLSAIVKAGGEVDYRNESGGSALQVACVCKAGVVTVKCLIEELGADPDLPNHNGNTPLMFAIRNKNDMDVCKYLAEKTRDIDAQTKSSEPKYPGYTALHFAAMESLPAHAAILITNGAKQEIKNEHGLTPLQLADEKTKTAMMSSSFAKFQLENPGPNGAHPAAASAGAIPEMERARRQTFQGEGNRSSVRAGPLRRTSMLAQQGQADAQTAAELSAHEPVILEDDEL